MTATSTAYPLVLAVQGYAKPLELEVPDDASAGDILSQVRAHTGRDDLIELLFEDAEDSIDHAEHVIETIRREFRLLHASTGDRITVTLTYESTSEHRTFRANATIRRVIAWAISKKGFDLDGMPAEFQIKLGNRVLPPDLHLGQAAHGTCALAAALVHNIKPQG